MAIVIGCPEGKHPDYQVWGANSNCMKKKMKKSCSFKEWLSQDEILVAEGLYDSLDTITQKIDLIPDLGNMPNTRKLITDIVMLNLKKQKDKNAEVEFKKKLEKIPFDIKPHLLKLLKDGNLGSFMDSLKDLRTEKIGQN